MAGAAGGARGPAVTAAHAEASLGRALQVRGPRGVQAPALSTAVSAARYRLRIAAVGEEAGASPARSRHCEPGSAPWSRCEPDTPAAVPDDPGRGPRVR